MKQILNGLEPFIVPDTKFLLLGSFPSIKSLEEGFYFMHPQNRFYKILSKVFNEETPFTIQERKDFLIKHHISVFDMIKSCNRIGSLDSKIKDIELNDIKPFINEDIKIGCIGKMSYNLFIKLYPNIKAIYLPSTSPANQSHFNEQDYFDFFN